MTIDNITFSEWRRWVFRKQMKGAYSPGLYLLGEFDEEPEGNADYLDKNVILIALTYGSKGIVGRLSEFHECIFTKKTSPCCEGPTYAEHCKQKKIYPFTGLFISMMPVNIRDETERREELMRVKRELLDEYEAKHGEYPLLNKIRG